MDDYTLDDVVLKIQYVQDMHLLFLQGVTLKGRDICIHTIVNRKQLIRILEKYRDHYDEVMGFRNGGSITIYNLNKLSFLRVGLEKEVLRFMEPYLEKEKTNF